MADIFSLTAFSKIKLSVFISLDGFSTVPISDEDLELFLKINFQESLGGLKVLIFRLASLDEPPGLETKTSRKMKAGSIQAGKKSISPFTNSEFSH